MNSNPQYNKQLYEHLSGFVLEDRLNRMHQVLNKRTRYLTVGLEDLFQEHNASAVMRTCDLFGVQDIHIVENAYKFHINKDIALGSSQWLTFYDHRELENNSVAAIKHLREKGYRIIATTPHTNDVNLEDFDIEKGKFVLFFGSEVPGLTKKILDNSDEFLKIPMHGFTESFNISVSAAVIMHHLIWKLHNSTINWQLSEDEKYIILTNWLSKSIRKSDLIIKEFNKKYFPDVENK